MRPSGRSSTSTPPRSTCTREGAGGWPLQGRVRVFNPPLVTCDLADACRECDIRFSFGYPVREPVREALLSLPESAWRPAIDQDGQPREGAWVTELTGKTSVPEWPEESRLSCRRERPHPGAQLSITDVDGHRFQRFITDQPDKDIAALEALHRQHAQVEDRVKTLKATGANFLAVLLVRRQRRVA